MFSARWKVTRPTAFQTGWQLFKYATAPPGVWAIAARTWASSPSHNRARTAPFKYSKPLIGGAVSASADHSVPSGFGMLMLAAFCRSGLWQSSVNNRWASPRQKTKLGGSGSCKNADASISKPHAGAAANPSVKRPAAAWLSFGSACSSGWTNRCPPGDNAKACDMTQEDTVGLFRCTICFTVPAQKRTARWACPTRALGEP